MRSKARRGRQRGRRRWGGAGGLKGRGGGLCAGREFLVAGGRRGGWGGGVGVCGGLELRGVFVSVTASERRSGRCTFA